jgi:hypothetical protein
MYINIIHNNHTQQSYIIISSIHKSHPLSLIHTHKSIMRMHSSLILSIQVSCIDIDYEISITH